jgi:hypothetical protein
MTPTAAWYKLWGHLRNQVSFGNIIGHDGRAPMRLPSFCLQYQIIYDVLLQTKRGNPGTGVVDQRCLTRNDHTIAAGVSR